MMASDTPTLKPCPFCGGEGELIVRDFTDDKADRGNAYVECQRCGVETAWRVSDNNAIAAWNTRATTADLAEALEVLGALLVVGDFRRNCEDVKAVRDLIRKHQEARNA